MAAGEELASEISLDASDFASGASEGSDAAEDLAGSSDDLSESLWEIDAAGMAAGGAMAGVGTAAQEALNDSQDWRETLGRTAESTEMTRDETTKLAQDLSNATFPMEDATKTMDILARQGVSTAEGLEKTANTADLVADATGTTAEAVAKNAGPALAAFGDDITDLEKHQDTLTHVTRNTTQSVEDFTKFIGKNREEIEDLGLSMDDTAAIMQHLEDQGYEGREAVRKFRQEANDADGDMGAFKDSIGLTEEGLQGYKSEIAESEGATKRYADSANESVTAMDMVGDKMNDAKLAAGEMLGPVSAIAPAMQTAGIAAMAMSTINMSSVVPSLYATAAAAAPVVIPLLAIATAAGALYVAWDKNLFGIRDIATDVFGRLQGLFDGFRSSLGSLVDWVKILLSGDFSQAFSLAKTKVIEVVTGLGDSVQRIVTDFITGIVGYLTSIGADDIKAAFKSIGTGIRKVVLGLFKAGGTLHSIIEGGHQAMVDYLREDAAADFKAAMRAVGDAAVEAFTSFIESLTPPDGLIRDLFARMNNYIENQAAEDVKAAIGVVIDGVMAAFTGLYDGLIGKSLIPDLFTDIAGHIAGTAKRLVTDAVTAVIDSIMGSLRLWYENVIGGGGLIKDLFASVASYISGTAAGDLASAAADAGKAMFDGLKNKFNSLMPAKLSIPKVTIGGGSVSLPSKTIAGKTIGGGSLNIPSASVGGQSVGLPSLDTGGRITDDGLAMLHAGEDVVPAADVDRSGGSSGPDQIVIDAPDDALMRVGDLNELLEEYLSERDRRLRKSRKASPKGA